MFLTRQEQQMLDGEHGEAVRQSMEILVALGKIYAAENMIPVTSAQIAGVSYKTIGDAGLEYLNDLAKAGAKVRIPSFLNPAGMDREQWKKMNIPERFAKKQLEILDAYSAMGITMSCTCTPYLVGIRPKLREHIAWSESSAVSFANSVLGARTNREGGPSALAAAVCGVTPYYGLHLDENRISDMVINIECTVNSATDFGALGSYAGELAEGRIPSFTGLKQASEDRLKCIGASMAAAGSVALFYAAGITPEFIVSDKPEKVTFTEDDRMEAKERLISGNKSELLTIGCPHASILEIKEIADMVRGKRLDQELWVCTARATKHLADEAGYTAIIESAGGKVIADTCMVVCPLEEMGYKATGTNSGKAAHYLASMCKQKVVFEDLKGLLSGG